MRVNVQLIEAETGAHVWAERFDKPVADLFEMQDEIVSRLANRLGVELVKAGALRAMRERPNNPDALDLAMQGWASINSWSMRVIRRGAVRTGLIASSTLCSARATLPLGRGSRR
jgi:hypothetical protein